VTTGPFFSRTYLCRWMTMGSWVKNNRLNRTSRWNLGTGARDLVIHNWDLITRSRV
jgi:hypothetical protein